MPIMQDKVPNLNFHLACIRSFYLYIEHSITIFSFKYNPLNRYAKELKEG